MRLGFYTATARSVRQAHREQVLRELGALSPDRLSPADRTNYDIFNQLT
jgi:hypothetical protein